MSLRRRARRPDAWATSHARAQAALSDRLDGDLELAESDWLDRHLAGCADCQATAAAYDAQRAELRAMGDRQPLPPRDLWARTSAAIEHESRFRDGRAPAGERRRRSAFTSVFAAALVVAVVVGTLTSSRLLFGGGPTAQPTEAPVAVATPGSSAVAAATPIPVGQHVQWISQGEDGSYTLRQADVRSVCPEGSDPCEATAPVEDQPVALTDQPQTVFGSRNGQQLIVVNRAGVSQDASVAVVTIEPQAVASPSPSDSTTASSSPKPPASVEPSTTPTQSAAPTKTPVATASVTPSAPASPSSPATPSPSATPSASPTTASASPTPSAPASVTPSLEASPTVAITPSASPDGAVRIAEDVILVGQSAAYSPNGEWFAFTARPADGSAGPDIYVWKVGEPAARAVTTDHRSAFGSWVGNDMAVGSSVAKGTEGATSGDAASYLLDPATGAQVPLPQTGRTWRPSVDPSGRRAVYWTGSLRRSSEAPVDLPDDGRLVVGDWATGDAAASGSPAATPLAGDQEANRHETTIRSGAMSDWDARWDSTGTKLAVWVADPDDPTVGALSLYAVDPFNGRVDLKKPLLDAQRATAGFSISDGKLVWAEPAADGSGTGRILVLAWTDQGTGTIETLPDKVIVIR